MKIRKSRWVKVIAWIAGGLALIIFVHITSALIIYPSEYIYRVLAWRDSDAFDWQKFPQHHLEASPESYYFATTPDPHAVDLFESISESEDWESFLADNQTQAFIVVKDGEILYENYFNNTNRDSIVTSFSVAKSFTSALIGIAIQEGFIHSVNDPITEYLPELAERDARFRDITIRDLLLMASGLEYVEDRIYLFNGDDPLTSYYPDQRKIALENTNINEPPGLHFLYNKYHPQLLGMILERATGMPVTDYMQTRLWDPLGMEFAGSWSIDSETSDFEKMETGVNARAIDFAKFGQLFLDGKNWKGEQVISPEWLAESTQPEFPSDYETYYPEYFKDFLGKGYYKYMWWGMARDVDDYDFAAEGDKGQYIYISPKNHLVIVRNGIDYGIPGHEWMKLFYEFAGEY